MGTFTRPWDIVAGSLPAIFEVDCTKERPVFYLMDDLLMGMGMLNTSVFYGVEEFKTDGQRLAGLEVLRRVASRTISFGKAFEVLPLQQIVDPGQSRGYFCPLTLELVTTTVARLMRAGLLLRFGTATMGTAPSYSLNFQKVFASLSERVPLLGKQFKQTDKIKDALKAVISHRHFGVACVFASRLGTGVDIPKSDIMEILAGVTKDMPNFKEMMAATTAKAKKAEAARLEKLQEAPILRWKTTVKKDMDVENRVFIYPDAVIAHWDNVVQKHDKFKDASPTVMTKGDKASLKSKVMSLVKKGMTEDDIREHFRLIVLGWSYIRAQSVKTVGVRADGTTYSMYLPVHPTLRLFTYMWDDLNPQLLKSAKRFQRPAELPTDTKPKQTATEEEVFHV